MYRLLDRLRTLTTPWRPRMELQGMEPYRWRDVIRRARLGPSTKLVACVLADYANPDGTRIWPGNDRLVAVTELGEKTVRRSLEKLRDLGLIERVRKGSKLGRKALADEYRLTIPADLRERVEMLAPSETPGSPVMVTCGQDGTPVTGTGDEPESPVDNPGSAVTVTGDRSEDQPGTPVNDHGTPVTGSRNTGHGDRPPTHAPNQLPPTNKPSGPVTPPTVEVPRTRVVTPSERAELESEDEALQFQAARTVLGRCGPTQTETLMEKARTEMDDPNVRQLIIRAAQIHAQGIPA